MSCTMTAPTFHVEPNGNLNAHRPAATILSPRCITSSRGIRPSGRAGACSACLETAVIGSMASPITQLLRLPKLGEETLWALRRLMRMRMFFHLLECGSVTSDEEGVELANLDAARSEALRAAREVMSAEVREGRLCLSCQIDITEGDGTPLMTLPFRDALVISGQK